MRNLLSISIFKILLGKEICLTPRTAQANGIPSSGEVGGEIWTGSGGLVCIERFELPNLRGVHFWFMGMLDRGVTSTSGIDFLGKNMSEFLRQR